ncbi:MAG: hypothetical protein ACP5MH_11490, partial [Thermoproteus sp.]
MNVVEATVLVIVFIIAMYLTVSNFLSTVEGYLDVLKSRYEVLKDAMAAGQKVYFMPSHFYVVNLPEGTVYLTPYYMLCTGLDVKLYRTEGFPALLINATYFGYPKGYYFLVPSPSYVIPANALTAATGQLPCLNPSQLVNESAKAF